MEQSTARSYPGAALPAHYFTAGSSSFTEFLSTAVPELLPGRLGLDRSSGDVGDAAPHGTTIVALTFSGGVVVAGDRRATMGNFIAQRDTEKVFVVDDYSAAGVAGSAGVAVEMVRLFAVELQHYEKIEGVSLTLDGKANKLASMVRGNLGAALQGLAGIPLFAGFDLDASDPDRAGRIVSFDVVGGRYEETIGYHAIGSGSLFARSALKKLHDPNQDQATAVRNAVEALYDAADDDTGTGGPDTIRRIYPTVVTVNAADGAARLPEEATEQIAEAVIAGRRDKPGG